MRNPDRRPVKGGSLCRLPSSSNGSAPTATDTAKPPRTDVTAALFASIALAIITPRLYCRYVCLSTFAYIASGLLITQSVFGVGPITSFTRKARTR